MSSDVRGVSVIIATLGLRQRAELLRAAIASVMNQAGVDARPIVVLNGTRACPDVERWLRADRRLRLLALDSADLPAALSAGCEAVQTPYFTALDDDDFLLPGALALRLAALEADPDLDVVVTNGYQRVGGHDELHMVDGTAINADPLRALLRRNWFLPGSWLCRTDRAGAELFSGMPRFLECTFLAARFSTTHHLLWLDTPTVTYRVGSPMAESRSRDYVISQAAALAGILALDLPADVRLVFERRVAAAHHQASMRDRAGGRIADAWRWHVASLRARGGWRYLPYTRHLLWDLGQMPMRLPVRRQEA